MLIRLHVGNKIRRECTPDPIACVYQDSKGMHTRPKCQSISSELTLPIVLSPQFHFSKLKLRSINLEPKRRSELKNNEYLINRIRQNYVLCNCLIVGSICHFVINMIYSFLI
ncbi:hypothetical protein L1887_43233 [Cichorium endivia]|nr:hypothetical protein L1887_43233 [Cichorium endivia]